jgi:hypothetical protein
MQMLKHNLQKWLLLFVKVWQPHSVFKMLFIQAMHSRSLKCRMSLLFTVDSVAGFFVLLVPSQEHLPPWRLLAYWERAKVPRLFYNRLLCQDPLYTVNGVIDIAWHHEDIYVIHLLRQGLVQAIFWHLKFNLFWCYSKRQLASLFDGREVLFLERVMISFCRLAWRYSAKADASLGAILDLSSPVIYFLFFFVSKSYLTYGLFSWCNLFLIAHSSIFLTCSNPGLDNLSCTVQIKLLQHNMTNRMYFMGTFHKIIHGKLYPVNHEIIVPSYIKALVREYSILSYCLRYKK